MSAVILQWNRKRKRYERQDLLVEDQALERAEAECLTDAEVRARCRARDSERRSLLDQQFVDQFATHIRELFPNCPPGREIKIAQHACLKHSGRVGRSATVKVFDEGAIRLAVTAHVRHTETEYDSLLMTGHERREARELVQGAVALVFEQWEKGQ